MRDKRISRLSKSDTVPQTKFARRRGPTPEQLRSEDERELNREEKIRNRQKRQLGSLCIVQGIEKSREEKWQKGQTVLLGRPPKADRL